MLSFRWLFNVRLKAFSLLSTYCIILNEVSIIWFGFYLLTEGIFCMFFLLYNFWRCLLFVLVDSNDYQWHGLQKRGFFSPFFFLITLSFKILLLPSISLGFLFLVYAIIGLPWNAFFSLGLICNKCQCPSMIFSMFGKVLLNFTTNGILGLFSIFVFWS